MRSLIRYAFFCWAALTALGSIPSYGDYLPFNGAQVAPNIAEIRIKPDGVHVQLEIYVADIGVFADLIPDDWLKNKESEVASQAERLKKFSESGLSIRRENGITLPVAVQLIEPRIRIDRASPLAGQRDPLSGQIFPAPPEDKRVVFVEMLYSFDANPPDAITIAPPRNEKTATQPVIGMVVFDRAVPVANFGYLSEPERLMIDWEDPWYTKFENRNLKRHHQSSTTTYLYIEPREFRHETLMRLRDIDRWIGLDLRSGDQLTPDRQEFIKSRAIDFLSGRNPVSIDQREQSSTSQRAELLTLDTTGFQIVDEDNSINADAAFVGVILSFPFRDLPDEVKVEWNVFDEQLTNIPATSIDLAGPFLDGATPDLPDIIWRNHLLTYENPAISPVTGSIAVTHPIPLVSIIAGLISLILGVIAVMARGRKRLVAASVAIAGSAVAFLLIDDYRIEMSNPLSRTPDAIKATMVFQKLLENVNIANLEVTNTARNRELTPLVSPAAFKDVAAELDRALAVRVPGGSIARVTEIRDLSLENIAPTSGANGYSAIAQWSSAANAGHFGHNHRRDLQYRALIEVTEDAGAWKISAITVVEARPTGT